MTTDLGSLTQEIEAAAKEKGLVLFFNRSRIEDTPSFIHWDTERYPDYHGFLDAAVACGVKLIGILDYKFSKGELETIIDSLKEADMTAGERRDFEKQLNALRVYVGFTSGLELTFDYSNKIYFFHLRTPWRIEFIRLAAMIDDKIYDDDDEEDEDDPIGGAYYSRN